MSLVSLIQCTHSTQIMKTINDDGLKIIFEDDDMLNLLLETGFRVPVSKITLEDKDAVTNALRDYHSIIKVRSVF